MERLGVYLAACKARHKNYNILYNDIDNKFKPDLLGDMLSINLDQFDFLIASPPCNYWSKANPYYKTSSYSANTKNLLPLILIKFALTKKPFIIENVKNFKRMKENGIFDICSHFGIFVYYVGRHTYFTNIMCNLECKQFQDFESKSSGHCKYIGSDGYRQGGKNVYNCIEIWLKTVFENNYF